MTLIKGTVCLTNPIIAMTELTSSHFSRNLASRYCQHLLRKILHWFITFNCPFLLHRPFYNGERVFDWIEVWRVWRKVFELYSTVL